MEERIAAQLLVERLAMQQAESLPQASTTKLVSSKAQPVTGHRCVVLESEPKVQQAPLVELLKSGVLHFAALNTVQDAFYEWPEIESQVEEVGGWKEVSKQSRTNFNKRRHLVQRIRMLIGAKPHGLSVEAACRVYAYIQQQGGLSLAELRDAVNHSEPVPDSSAKGGRPASWKDNDPMPREKHRVVVTKKQILSWRKEALQVELSQVEHNVVFKL